jgi:acetyl-CoA carboxylase biotin carboxyl carrier protein
MDFETIEKYIELLKKHGLAELKIGNEKEELKIRAHSGGQPSVMPYYPQGQSTNFANGAQMVSPPPSATPASETAATSSGEQRLPPPPEKTINSPFVGTFYLAPSPDSDVFVTVGQRVKKGDTLCIVEAMKLMNEIEADCEGVIKKILVENEEPVEFDQPLFVLE